MGNGKTTVIESATVGVTEREITRKAMRGFAIIGAVLVAVPFALSVALDRTGKESGPPRR